MKGTMLEKGVTKVRLEVLTTLLKGTFCWTCQLLVRSTLDTKKMDQEKAD